MSLRSRVSCFPMLLATLLLSVFFATSTAAQQPTGAGKALTVERIYSQPSLSGRLTRGLVWTPGGQRLSYFETNGYATVDKTALSTTGTSSGRRGILAAY